MEEYTGCMATTRSVDKNNRIISLSKDGLADQAREINEVAHIPVTLDHNPLLMPIGRSDSAWIERIENKVSLMAKYLVEMNATAQQHLKSGTKIAYLRFGESKRGFVRYQEEENTGGINIQIDPSDFENLNSWQMFVQETTDRNNEVRVRNHERFSQESIGLITMIMSDPQGAGLLGAFGALAIWVGIRVENFVRHTIDETFRKMGDGISDKWSKVILQTLKHYEKAKSKTNKKYIWMLVLQGKPDITLVSERETEENGDGIHGLDLNEIFNEFAKYKDLLTDAQEITLIKAKHGRWKFQHVKTVHGEIIGDWQCYKETRRRWIQMQEEYRRKNPTSDFVIGQSPSFTALSEEEVTPDDENRRENEQTD